MKISFANFLNRNRSNTLRWIAQMYYFLLRLTHHHLIMNVCHIFIILNEMSILDENLIIIIIII